MTRGRSVQCRCCRCRHQTEGIGGGNESNVCHLLLLLCPAEPGTPDGLRPQYYKPVEQIVPFLRERKLFLTIPFLRERKRFTVLSLVYQIHLTCTSIEFNETCMLSCSSIAGLLANRRSLVWGERLKLSCISLCER